MTAREPPAKLYKYRPLRTSEHVDRVLQIIDGHLYAATRSEFNDPFDCAPMVKPNPDREQFRVANLEMIRRENPNANRAEQRRILSAVEKRISKDGAGIYVLEAVNAVLSWAGIISLTEVPDSILMWGHYASEHTGVCIGFKARDSNPGVSEALQVIYSEARPTIYYPGDKDQLFHNSFLIKASCWEYEREWRIINRYGSGNKRLYPDALATVIFGARASEAHIKRISEHVAMRHPGSKVSICQAKLAPSSYEMEIVGLAT